jgi:prophage antirepressor-like protein
MYIFAASFKLIGKRKPAIHIAGIFYALTTYLYIAAATPVWSINVPTAYEVKDNGKGQPFFLPKCQNILQMATNSIQVLKQTELCGRQFTVYGTVEEPLFRAKDVAEVINHNNISHMLSLVDDDEKGVTQFVTPGGNQQVWMLTEGGLYEVLMQSRKPIAKQFKKGVKQILHEVRTTGGYISTTPNDTPEEIMARALTIAQATLAKREERLKQLEAETEQQQATIELQDKEIKEAAPKVNYYNNHLQSVNTLTSTQIAKQIGMDAEKLHKKLKESNVIYRQSGQWLLHSPYSTWGLHSTRTQTYTRSDGSIGTNVYTVWTERGRRFIIALYENEWNVRRAIKQIKGEITPAT